MDYDYHEAMKLGNQLCFPVYAASRVITSLYTPYLKPLGLTYTQYITMMVIWETGRINVKELGDRLYLDSGTLTPVLKSLEAKGYINRRRSKEDERILNVEITEAGELLRGKAENIPDKVFACADISAPQDTFKDQKLKNFRKFPK